MVTFKGVCAYNVKLQTKVCPIFFDAVLSTLAAAMK